MAVFGGLWGVTDSGFRVFSDQTILVAPGFASLTLLAWDRWVVTREDSAFRWAMLFGALAYLPMALGQAPFWLAIPLVLAGGFGVTPLLFLAHGLRLSRGERTQAASEPKPERPHAMAAKAASTLGAYVAWVVAWETGQLAIPEPIFGLLYVLQWVLWVIKGLVTMIVGAAAGKLLGYGGSRLAAYLRRSNP